MKEFPEEYEKSKLDGLYRGLGLPDETLELLQKYFDAFNSFYFIFSMEDAYTVINSQNKGLISREKFAGFAEIQRHDETHHYSIAGADELFDDEPDTSIWDREIVHEMFFMDDDLEGYTELRRSCRNKPLYVPEKEELLRYSQEYYCAASKHADDIVDFLCDEVGFTRQRAELNVDDAVGFLNITFTPYEDTIARVINGISSFNRFDRSKLTKLQMSKFVSLLCDLANNTRMAFNRGFTPNELAEKYGISGKSVAGVSAETSGIEFTADDVGLLNYIDYLPTYGYKIGRNDPCPCGSGKKYKKCCGR